MFELRPMPSFNGCRTFVDGQMVHPSLNHCAAPRSQSLALTNQSTRHVSLKRRDMSSWTPTPLLSAQPYYASSSMVGFAAKKELQSASDANEPKGSLDVTVRPIVSL